MHLLEHLVDVDRVGLAPLLLALPALGALSLGLLLFLGLLFLRLGGHAAEAHAVDEFLEPPAPPFEEQLPVNTHPRALGATATHKSLRRHKARAWCCANAPFCCVTSYDVLFIGTPGQ